MAKKTRYTRFLDTSPEEAGAGKPGFTIFPIPYEKTTTYGKGTDHGPEAILEASKELEYFDEELEIEPYLAGIQTLPPICVNDASPAQALLTLEKKLTPLFTKAFTDRSLPIVLGGEHSITIASLKAFAKCNVSDVSILYFDAHADLRDVYLRTKYNHACVARRLVELGFPVTMVGTRSLSKEEYDFLQNCRDVTIFWAREFETATIEKLIRTIIKPLKQHVYISFDVDVLDSSLVPATGTPEPGGLSWQHTLRVLREVCAHRHCRGIDIIELSPIKGHHASDFTIARLLYKLIGYVAIHSSTAQLSARKGR